jgi:hypothetical protein
MTTSQFQKKTNHGTLGIKWTYVLQLHKVLTIHFLHPASVRRIKKQSQ